MVEFMHLSNTLSYCKLNCYLIQIFNVEIPNMSWLPLSANRFLVTKWGMHKPRFSVIDLGFSAII
jgi:hypothetical protein